MTSGGAPPPLVIGHWCLVICWSLRLGHWSFHEPLRLPFPTQPGILSAPIRAQGEITGRRTRVTYYAVRGVVSGRPARGGPRGRLGGRRRSLLPPRPPGA